MILGRADSLRLEQCDAVLGRVRHLRLQRCHKGIVGTSYMLGRDRSLSRGGRSSLMEDRSFLREDR